LLIQKGEIHLAAQLAGLIGVHASRTPNVLAEFLPTLQTQLELEALEAELAKGRKLELDSVVRQILAEYG
jgi:hypothetical protein